MLTTLLQVAQQVPNLAKQVAPNLYVTVQPPPAGMPEWEKILITAGTGALFGIAGALATEVVKTHFAKMKLKKVISTQLTAELTENLDHVETCTEILMTASMAGQLDLDSTFARVRTNARYIDDDRYQYYFVREKLLVYEIDPDKSLADFYNRIKLAMEGIDEVDGEFASASFKLAVLLGIRYLRSQGINRTLRPHLYEQLHQEAVDGIAKATPLT